MKTGKNLYRIGAVIIVIVILAGALFVFLSADPVEKSVRKILAAQQPATGDASPMLAKAKKLRAKAVDKEGVLDLVRAYEEVLKVDPQNYEALWNLSNNYDCLAVSYEKDKKVREKYHIKSMENSILALCTNPEFKEKYLAGEPHWECFEVLTPNQMWALYWYWGSYIDYAVFKGNESKINMAPLLIRRTPKSLFKAPEVMLEIAPDFFDGALAHGIHGANYTAPEYAGGDLKKSAEHYDKSINGGPYDWFNAVMRLSSLDIMTKDRKTFIADAKLVLAAKVPVDDPLFPWHAPVKTFTTKLLDNIDLLEEVETAEQFIEKIDEREAEK